MKNIPFCAPEVGIEELDEIKDVLNLSKESKIEKLEKNFRDYVRSDFSISTISGTASLHLAMCAIDLKRGDKIICSVNSFVNVPEVIRHFDAEPIFVDIDGDDFNIDLNKFEELLVKNRSKKLKAAVISHVAGQPVDMYRLYEISRKFKIKIIEDATNALGASYDNRKVGSTGSCMSVFSFNPNQKHALANGGMLITNNEELANRARLLRNHAIVTNGWDKYGNLDYVYDVVDIGCKYDLSELEASYNIVQLKKVEKQIERRKEIANIYFNELKVLPNITLPVVKRDHIFQQFIIKIDKNRDSFAKKLKEKGISVGLHYIPLHLLSYYKTKYNLRVNDYPVALRNYQQILSIPIYPTMSNEDVSYVCEQIIDISKNR